MESKGAALVTGGAIRLGRAIALGLAEEGYDIALHYRNSKNEARATADKIRACGRKCQTFCADLLDSTEVISLSENVFSEFSNYNLLVNNASVFEPSDFLNAEVAELERDININFRAPFLLMQEFARKCSKGQVINLLDSLIEKPRLEYFTYSLSKNMLQALTKMAARRLAPNVRVNAVCPGIILAPFGTEELIPDKIKDVPLGRSGKPEDIASTVRFIAANSYLNGEIIFVDGGEHLV